MKIWNLLKPSKFSLNAQINLSSLALSFHFSFILDSITVRESFEVLLVCCYKVTIKIFNCYNAYCLIHLMNTISSLKDYWFFGTWTYSIRHLVFEFLLSFVFCKSAICLQTLSYKESLSLNILTQIWMEWGTLKIQRTWVSYHSHDQLFSILILLFVESLTKFIFLSRILSKSPQDLFMW